MIDALVASSFGMAKTTQTSTPSTSTKALQDAADARAESTTIYNIEHLSDMLMRARNTLAFFKDEGDPLTARWMKALVRSVTSAAKTLREGGTPKPDRLQRAEALLVAAEQAIGAIVAARPDIMALMAELPED